MQKFVVFVLSLLHRLCKIIIKKIARVVHVQTLTSVTQNIADLRYCIIKCGCGSTSNECTPAHLLAPFGRSLTLNLKLIKEFSFMRSISSCVLLCIFLQVFSSYFCSFFHGAVRFCFSHIHSLFCLNMVFFHPLTHSLLSAESLDSFTSYILLLFDVNELYGS